MTKDSITGATKDTQSLNRYAYAEGDPVNHVDLTGHSADETGDPNHPYVSIGAGPADTGKLEFDNGPAFTQGGPTIISTSPSIKSLPSSRNQITNQQLISVGLSLIGAVASTAALIAGTATIGWVAIGIGMVAFGYQAWLYHTGADRSKLNLALAALGGIPIFGQAVEYANTLRGLQLGEQAIRDSANLLSAGVSYLGYYKTYSDLQ